MKKRLARTLEAEAGLNDPVAILLVIGFIEWIQLPDYGVLDMAVLFVEEIGIGALVGLAVGIIAVYGIRAVSNVTSGLYPVATVATAASAFGLAQVHPRIGIPGRLHRRTDSRQRGACPPSARSPTSTTASPGSARSRSSWCSDCCSRPPRSVSLWYDALVVTLLLMFVARPIAVYVATLFARFEFREVVLLQWAGMRGAVPIVLATFPLVDGIADSNAIYNIVFFVVLASAIFQGTTFEWLAKRLDAHHHPPRRRAAADPGRQHPQARRGVLRVPDPRGRRGRRTRRAPSCSFRARRWSA